MCWRARVYKSVCVCSCVFSCVRTCVFYIIKGWKYNNHITFDIAGVWD
ncbi:hypothetical protein MAR_022981 [Mya arenaria]|uniref:Uncharacterized protein n=1 Tax=Mya arenaria TaxID=6604 RepID=A0ABY7DR89_MYAAR|nr:hypothetical protein MAR_022981 [Mya arenaria]